MPRAALTPPKPPAKYRDKILKGLGQSDWREYVARRNAWLHGQFISGVPMEDIKAALHRVRHPLSDAVLLKLRAKSLGPSRTPSASVAAVEKVSKAEIAMIANLIHELVGNATKPLRDEVLRLRGIEKKYKALRAAFVEDDA